MNLITKETDYAIRALIYLALNNSRYRSAREVSEENRIPYQFLRRIFKKLCDKSIVKAKEGKLGGVKINKKPGNIKVLDIIEIFQGDLQLSACMFRNRICSNRKSCVIRKRIKSIEQIVEKEFELLTIASLVAGVRNG